MMLLGNQKSVFFKGVTLGIPTTLESRSMLKNNLYSFFFFVAFSFLRESKNMKLGGYGEGRILEELWDMK